METNANSEECFFSVELKSKANLKNVTIANGSQDSVLIEGTVGRLLQAAFIEDLILEITGEKGTLRINLEKQEIKELPPSAASKNLSINCSSKSIGLQSDSEEVSRCK